MTKKESQCKDMADVCELAHANTVKAIRKLNASLPKRNAYSVNCDSWHDCKDKNQLHKNYGTHYGAKAQDIFNTKYDELCELSGL